MSIGRVVMVLLCLGQGACSMSAASAGGEVRSAPVVAPVEAVDASTLAGYHWKLQSATDAQGARIAALFVRPDRPVQLDFADGRLSVSQLCNAKAAPYRIEQGRLLLGPMLSTMMACVQPQLDALDQAVVRRLSSKPAISLDREGAMPQLKLVTASGDVLLFTGQPTAETRYGGPGATMFLEVAPREVPCDTPMSRGATCLNVRERHYDSHGLKAGEPGPWHALVQTIEGYTHAPGVRNVLRVKRYASGTAVGDVYVLDMVVESQSATPP